tara:strand:- start:115 stop:573 length:459 start_codon:yes stop_codon:yes gene_type:complete
MFIQISVHSQNDTIYALDTIISSVRVINQNENKLNYYYLDTNNNKHIRAITLEKVNSISYENKTIEVFCDLVSKKKFLSTQEIISINYGTRDSLWIDPKIYTLAASELKEYGYIVDALNYMGNEGWKIVNTYSTSDNSYIVEHYILKKEIKK